MNTPAPLNLVPVSERRRNFLSEWRRERAIRLALAKAGAADAEASPPPKACCDMPAARASDHRVTPGEIRLLGPASVAAAFRPAYVAVLDLYPDQGVALIAPFSPFSNPATKDEWLTGLESTPLRVLQLWNAQPVPLFALARSWRCCTLTDGELRDARTLYRHAVAGTWAPPELREQTGLAIHDPADDRLAYQDEELALYSPLREALFNLRAAVENPAEIRCRDGAWQCRKNAQTIHPAELLVADDGSVFAQVAILSKEVPERSLLAKRLSHTRLESGEWESRWKIVDWPDATPGLPVCAYVADPEREAPFATTFTRLDGTLVLFQGSDRDVFDKLGQPDRLLLILLTF